MRVNGQASGPVLTAEPTVYFEVPASAAVGVEPPGATNSKVVSSSSPRVVEGDRTAREESSRVEDTVRFLLRPTVGGGGAVGVEVADGPAGDGIFDRDGGGGLFKLALVAGVARVFGVVSSAGA